MGRAYISILKFGNENKSMLLMVEFNGRDAGGGGGG